MRITLPHMGTIYIAFNALFRELGVEYVRPPLCSQRTLSLGSRHSPEFVCVPFKLNLGNFIEACELGADTLLMAAGPGLCRFGYYHKLHARALLELGFNFQMVTTEPFEGGRITGVLERLRCLLNNPSWPRVIQVVRFALAKIGVLDDLERTVHFVRPRELVPGTASKLWQLALNAVDDASDYHSLKLAKRDCLDQLRSVPLDSRAQVPRVGIIGELYLVLEPFANHHIEEELGRLGVEVHRTIFVSEWTKHSLLLAPLGFQQHKAAHEAARPYLTRDVGGDGWESVGETILHARHGFDGMVHLAPFTCMPEVVAQNILPSVSRAHNIPVLTVVCDEQTGRAGLITRLEAYVDLLRRRQKRPA